MTHVTGLAWPELSIAEYNRENLHEAVSPYVNARARSGNSRARVGVTRWRMSNYFKIDRGVFSHPLFDQDEFSRRDAWAWMIGNACYRDLTSFISGRKITLKRGQLSYSIRFMAEKWLWSKAKTEYFLRALKSETMIETVSETGQLIITICNYDKYQTDDNDYETANRTEIRTATGQQQDSNRTKKNTGKKENKDKQSKKESITPTLFPEQEARLSPSGGDNVSRAKALNPRTQGINPRAAAEKAAAPAFEEFWQAYPRKTDKVPAQRAFLRALGKTTAKIIISAAELYADECHQDLRPEARRYIKHPSTWLNANCWENYDGAEKVDLSQLSETDRVAEILRMTGEA